MRSLSGRSPTTMPAVAEVLCQRCGRVTEESVATHGGRPVAACACGGVRQVLRILRREGEHPIDPVELERSMQHRSTTAGPRK